MASKIQPLEQKCLWGDGCITPSPKVKAEWLHYPTLSLWGPREDGCITPSPKVKAEWLHYPTPSLWCPREDGCITASPKVKAEWLHYPTPGRRKSHPFARNDVKNATP